MRTRVQVRAGVSQEVALQFAVDLKLLAAPVALIRPYVAVDTTFVKLQVARSLETSVADRTLVRLIDDVDPHVAVQSRRLTKGLVTHVTLVQLLSAVNFAVCNKGM